MKIVSDIQPLQTLGSKNRGIGRYTRNLYNTILRIDKKNSYNFFSNGSLSDEISLNIGNNQITPITNLPKEKNLQKNQIVNELSQFLQVKSLQPDLIHVNSPFESASMWEAATNKFPVVSRFMTKIDCPLVVTLYDLIPVIFSNEYLTNKSKVDFYRHRLNLIKNADLIFSISESTRQDAISILDIEPQKIVNIDSAPSDNFHVESKKNSKKMLKNFLNEKKFILYTASFEPRKNFELAIESFSKAKQDIKELKFVIVCNLDVIQKAKFQKITKKFNVINDVIITGKISDEKLNSLYNLCNLFYFPSIYEGSGLPILEAMKCNAPIIASNTSSMAEIITEKKFLFDPYNVDEMADLIKKSILDLKFSEDLKEFSLMRGKDFSWKKCAENVLSEFEKIKDKSDTKEKKSLNFDNEDNIVDFISTQLISNNLSNPDDSILNFLSEQIFKITRN